VGEVFTSTTTTITITSTITITTSSSTRPFGMYNQQIITTILHAVRPAFTLGPQFVVVAMRLRMMAVPLSMADFALVSRDQWRLVVSLTWATRRWQFAAAEASSFEDGLAPRPAAVLEANDGRCCSTTGWPRCSTWWQADGYGNSGVENS
jgi:hypothetical protein